MSAYLCAGIWNRYTAAPPAARVYEYFAPLSASIRNSYLNKPGYLNKPDSWLHSDGLRSKSSPSPSPGAVWFTA